MANITWISLLFISVLIVNVTSDECAVKGEPFKFSRTFSSFEPGVLWKRGPTIIAFVSVDATVGSGCVNVPESGYTFECPDNGTTYVLGIDQSSDIDGQTITTNPPSQEGDFTMKVIETRNGTLIIPMVDGLNTTLTKFTFYVNCTKPNATITWAFLPKGDGELTNGIPFNSSVPTTHESSDTGCDIDQFSWTSTISISSDTEQLKLTNHTTFILIARLSFLGCDAVSNVYLYPTDVIIITRDSTITPPTPGFTSSPTSTSSLDTSSSASTFLDTSSLDTSSSASSSLDTGSSSVSISSNTNPSTIVPTEYSTSRSPSATEIIIIVGVSAGVFIIAVFIVIVIICIRRKRAKTKTTGLKLSAAENIRYDGNILTNPVFEDKDEQNHPSYKSHTSVNTGYYPSHNHHSMAYDQHNTQCDSNNHSTKRDAQPVNYSIPTDRQNNVSYTQWMNSQDQPAEAYGIDKHLYGYRRDTIPSYIPANPSSNPKTNPSFGQAHSNSKRQNTSYKHDNVSPNRQYYPPRRYEHNAHSYPRPANRRSEPFYQQEQASSRQGHRAYSYNPNYPHGY